MIIFRRYLSSSFYLKRLDIEIRDRGLTEFSLKMVYILFLLYFLSSFCSNWCYLKNRVSGEEWLMGNIICLRRLDHGMILMFKGCWLHYLELTEWLEWQVGELSDIVLTVVAVALQGAMVPLGEHWEWAVAKNLRNAYI